MLAQAEAQVKQAEAQVKQAEAAWVAAQDSANSSHVLVAQALASAGRSDAELSRWKSASNRMQQLVRTGSAISKLADDTASQFQAAQAAKQEALAAIEFAKARQQEAEANITITAADVDAAKAKLRAAQADLQLAETIFRYTDLISPFDGYIVSRHLDAGHYVQPAGSSNAAPLMTLANLDKVRVFVNIPESEAAWVDAGFQDPGKEYSVTILVASGDSIDARVTRKSLQFDPQSRSLLTEVDLENTDLKLLPGALITAKILLEERTDVWMLPISAIVKTATETICCLVVDGRIQHRSVELGLRVGDEIQTLTGLEGHETVVFVRANSLQEGQSFAIIEQK